MMQNTRIHSVMTNFSIHPFQFSSFKCHKFLGKCKSHICYRTSWQTNNGRFKSYKLTANPTVPNPNTATEDPGETFPILQADPIPVHMKEVNQKQLENFPGFITNFSIRWGIKSCTCPKVPSSWSRWEKKDLKSPVATPHPSRQIFSRGALGFTLAQQASSSTVYWLKVEVPKKW